MTRFHRLFAIIFSLIVFVSDAALAQWSISPSVGVEFALPRYKSFNDTWFHGHIQIQDNPQPTLHLGLDVTRDISEELGFFVQIVALRYKFPVLTRTLAVPSERTVNGEFRNIRTTMGAKYLLNENFRIGPGISLDFSYSFRYHDEDGERLDTERIYKITRNLGLNLNALTTTVSFFWTSDQQGHCSSGQ
jgi:hypothetical protein